MKTIELTTTGDLQHAAACEFANSVYQEAIGAPTRTPPNIIFTARTADKIHGCIGLNLTVTTEIFRNDERFWKFLKDYPDDVKVGEQNVFAVKQFPAGILLLLAVESAYAQSLGIEKIAFTGIEVSCKALRELGFEVTVLGSTSPTHFSYEEREKYAYWLEHYQPLSCILDTGKARRICKDVTKRFSHKAKLSLKLEACLDI